MNKVLFKGLLSLFVLASVLTPIATADTHDAGRPTNIPGIDFPIIPGVNAPFASAPAGAPAVNPDGSLVNPPIVLPPGFRPGDAAPLPPPLFNPDGTPFVIGTPLEMPVRADGTRLSYDFDPLTGLYMPVTRVANEPVPPTGPGAPIYNPVIVNPDGTIYDPSIGAPLPPPLFNPDGTAFKVGSKLDMPIRADGTRLSYEYDLVTGLYWPPATNVGTAVVEPAPGVIATTFVYDQIKKQMVSVSYRSAQLPPVNPDGSFNDASRVAIPVVKEATPFSAIPKAAQIGSWAVIGKNGVVINAIVCSEKVCGADGDWGGKFTDPVSCPDGCELVLQVPPNPVTGQSMGGYLTAGSNKVTYKNGAFKVESKITLPADSTGKVGVAKTVVRTIKDGIITDVTGEKVDLSTGYQIPSVIKDANLKKQVDAALKTADIDPVKTATGYQLATEDALPAIDATLKVVAVKKGAKAKTLKLTVDQTGELFVPTTADLSGYEIQIKRGSKVLTKVAVA